MKVRGIKFIMISILIQCIINFISYLSLYTIASIFHESNVSYHRGIDFYPLMLMYLTWFVIVCITLTTFVQQFIQNELFITGLHLSWLIFIILFTIGDLKYRPYDFGLIIFCIALTLPVRIITRKYLYNRI